MAIQDQIKDMDKKLEEMLKRLENTEKLTFSIRRIHEQQLIMLERLANGHNDVSKNTNKRHNS